MKEDKIAKFISQKRKELKLTQAELGEKLNVTDKAVSKWENGRCMPDIGIIPDLCKIFNCDIIELLNGGENNKEIVLDIFKENNNNLKKKKLITITSIIIIILLSASTMFFSDYKRLLLNDKPKYMIRINNNYYGLFYKAKINLDNVYYGTWLYTFQIKNNDNKPIDLYIINKDNRIKANTGSMHYKNTINGIKSYIIQDTVSPDEMIYDNYLEVKNNDILFLDKDLNIKSSQIYNENINLNHSKYSININNLAKGKHLLVININNGEQKGWYSILINVKN